METTRLSSKGQIVLPSATRANRKWRAGTEFEVIETPDGVLLRPLGPFPPTQIDDVFGMARFRGRKRSIDEMDASVRAEAARRR
jgi:AbrB family looped-hinge helix DNA binding protein